MIHSLCTHPAPSLILPCLLLTVLPFTWPPLPQVGLFMLQRLGTHRVSFLFSPMVVIWMFSIFGIGIYNLSLYGTTVFRGLSPHYIVTFFADHKDKAWESLGGVMLTLTGAEALFADLGHFSIASVGVGFSFFVYPCIIFTYLGQGAMVIARPDTLSTVFWSAVPSEFFWPMLVIATCTAVVASQALISGSFSIIRQAMTLGVFPPLHVVHTGEYVEGQIYIGAVNYSLMIMCIAVVVGFEGNSTKIGNAYGIAVATVMVITTGLVILVMLVDWEVSALLVVPFALIYLTIECGLLSANLIKVPEGGWFAYAVTAGVALIMFIWISGQNAKRRALQEAKPSTTHMLITDILAPQPTQGTTANPVGMGTHATLGASPVSPAGPLGTGAGAMESASGRPLMRLSTRGRRLGSDLQPLGGNSNSDSRPSNFADGQYGGTSSFAIEITVAGGGEAGADPVTRLPMVWEESTDIKKGATTGEGSTANMAPAVNMLNVNGDVGLARLRGIGVYYVDIGTGVPPVMWHFLRNVEAVHEVVVLLQNHFLPIPYLSSLPGVDETQRFGSCKPVDGIPHMYRVVARYGYMDIVDHGPQFVDHLKEYIKSEVKNGASNSMHMRRTQTSGGLLEEEGAGSGEGEALEGGVMMRQLDPEGLQEELRVLDAAYEQGVVYYLGRTRLRMKKMNNVLLQELHDIWYGDLYKLLANNCWDRSDAWKVPSNSLVEMAIVLEV